MPSSVSPGVALAVRKITQQLRRPVIDRQLTNVEGQILLSFLNEGNVQAADVSALIDALISDGVIKQFMQTAHPRWGPYVREWLRDRGVPWQTIHNYYRYDVRDSIDFYAGFLLGMGVALTDLPIMLAKLGLIIIEGKLVDEADAFFAKIGELWQKELLPVLQEQAAKWREEFDDLIYRLEWFKAGFKLGTAITTAALFGYGALKLIASLPKFIKFIPVAASEVNLFVRRTAGASVRTLEEARALVRATAGYIYVLQDFRYSYLVATMVNAAELRSLLTDTWRLITKYGYELIYVENVGVSDVLMMSGGPIPTSFVSEAAVIIRRGGVIVGRIFNPRSLARAWQGLADEDIAAHVDAMLADHAMARPGIASEELHKLAEKAAGSAEFAGSATTLKLTEVAEEYLKAIAKRLEMYRDALKQNPNAKLPTEANFGTLVESDMQPILRTFQKKYPHLTFHSRAKLQALLGSRVEPGNNFLKMTVERYLKQNGLLSQELGYNGKNFSKVLAVDPATIMGELQVDLFIEDPFGHQGVLIDFTAGLDEAHWGKNLLYHAAISDVLPNMRLPLGEIYHFGVQYGIAPTIR